MLPVPGNESPFRHKPEFLNKIDNCFFENDKKDCSDAVL